MRKSKRVWAGLLAAAMSFQLIGAAAANEVYEQEISVTEEAAENAEASVASAAEDGQDLLEDAETVDPDSTEVTDLTDADGDVVLAGLADTVSAEETEDAVSGEVLSDDIFEDTDDMAGIEVEDELILEAGLPEELEFISVDDALIADEGEDEILLEDGFAEEDLSVEDGQEESLTDLTGEEEVLVSDGEDADAGADEEDEEIVIAAEEDEEDLSVDEAEADEAGEEEEILIDGMGEDEEDVDAAELEDAAGETTLSSLFPDASFRAYIKANYSEAKDTMTSAQAAALRSALSAETAKNKTVDLSGKGIANVTGIKLFTRLETLNLSGNTMTSADLSGMALVNLNMSNCASLTSVKLTNTADLMKLNLSGCKKLGSLDVTTNTKLTVLDATGTNLSSLNVAKNTKLEELYCGGTQITSLNVSANTFLRKLVASNALISSVNLGSNSNLFYLDLSFNRTLSAIDVSKVTMLRELYLANTNISNLNISNHAALHILDLSNVPLTSLNAAGCKALTLIDFRDWGITTVTSLDVSNCTALTSVYCSGTAMNKLTLAGCTSLGSIYCADTAVSALDLSSCTRLLTLDCHHTTVSSLDVTKCKNLQYLNCNQTLVKSLNLTNNESLACLDVQETGIGSLDLRQNTSLEQLLCGRTVTKIYLNELKNNALGTYDPMTVIDNYGDFPTNSSARIIAYYPLGSTSWGVPVQKTYAKYASNVTWWPYDPQTGNLYCRNAETSAYGKANGEHNWTTVYDVVPTCSKAGKTHLACKACGETQANSTKTVKATGKHAWSAWTDKIGRSTAAGTVEHRTCKTCSLEQTRTKKNPKTKKAEKPFKESKAVFARLQPRGAATSTKAIKVTWNVIPEATHYFVYGALCGADTMKLLKTLKAPSKKSVKTMSYKQTKLKAGTYYKYTVVAYKYIPASGYYQTVESAALVHVPTKGGKYSEYKTAIANRKKLSLATSKTYVVQVASDLRYADKKVHSHAKGVRYESTDPSVVKVSSKGKLKALKKGTAYVYCYMSDGTFGRTKVTVR